MAEVLKVTTRKVGDAYVCVLEGPVDSYNAEKFESVPLDAFLSGAKKLIFDLEAVPYVASAGLGIFAKAFRSFPGRVVFVGTKPYVAQTFRISGFEKYATLSANLEAALIA